MSVKPGKRALAHPDRRALVFAMMFLCCALISALGAGLLALLGFVPAAAAVELLLRRPGRRSGSRYQRRS